MPILYFKMFTFIITICTCIQLLHSFVIYLKYFKNYIYLHLCYIAKSLSTFALSGSRYCLSFFARTVVCACVYYVQHLTISFLPAIIYIWRCLTHCFLFLIMAITFDSFYYLMNLLDCFVNLFING